MEEVGERAGPLTAEGKLGPDQNLKVAPEAQVKSTKKMVMIQELRAASPTLGPPWPCQLDVCGANP